MKILQKFMVASTWLHIATIIGGCASETLVATPSQFNIARALHTHDHILCRTSEGATTTRSIDMVQHRRVDEVMHLEFGSDDRFGTKRNAHCILEP
jgi:hypothetical protein